MAQNRLYVIETWGGMCIYDARSIRSARKAALEREGYDNLKSVRRATEADVAWVAGMGGYVPNGVCDPSPDQPEIQFQSEKPRRKYAHAQAKE